MKLEKDTMISHYEILSSIGKGGMGEVYLAEYTRPSIARSSPRLIKSGCAVGR
jgi:serine/threonine protein kinase